MCWTPSFEAAFFFSLKEVGSGTLAVVKVMNKTAKIRLDLVGRRSYRGGVLIYERI